MKDIAVKFDKYRLVIKKRVPQKSLQTCDISVHSTCVAIEKSPEMCI